MTMFPPEDDDDDGEPRVLLTRDEKLRLRAPWRDSFIIELFCKRSLMKALRLSALSAELLVTGKINAPSPNRPLRPEPPAANSAAASLPTDPPVNLATNPNVDDDSNKKIDYGPWILVARRKKKSNPSRTAVVGEPLNGRLLDEIPQ
ncbi:hypothetical protein CRG98_024015 [Punica granatum]|uniref:Uncharacterized protein n=1 Tax=Punica granatum TaxID=22663 RepID=A0A2I0JH59_PUNGR|nr:hypothetical protein CRG98_024015 [Punica granatum]